MVCGGGAAGSGEHSFYKEEIPPGLPRGNCLNRVRHDDCCFLSGLVLGEISEAASLEKKEKFH